MSSPGRPTDYKPEYSELAHNYCLLGATNAELADFFGAARRTIDHWIANHPDFAAAVHSGRAPADAKIARCLFARATGFSHEVTRTSLYQGEEKKITNTVRYPPDTQACMFWLRNRRRRDWRERVEPAQDVAADMAALDAALDATLDAGGEEARDADAR